MTLVLSFTLNKNTTYEAFAFSVVRPYSTLKITFKQELFIQLSGIPHYKDCKGFSRQSSRKNLNICDEYIVLNE